MKGLLSFLGKEKGWICYDVLEEKLACQIMSIGRCNLGVRVHNILLLLKPALLVFPGLVNDLTTCLVPLVRTLGLPPRHLTLPHPHIQAVPEACSFNLLNMS